MSTGDTADIFSRLKRLLPVGWFGDNNPVLDAVLWGCATAQAWAYTLYLYAKDQTRIKTATDGWLDLISLDFFGNGLIRYANQADASFRNRILINIFRERTTRPAMEKILFDLTGRAPIIIEPARPADVGAYGAAVAVSQPGITTMVNAAGALVYVPPNTARYEANQLLVEPSVTNLMKYSEQFENALYVKTGSSVLPNAGSAPDGTNDAEALIETAVNSSHHIEQLYTGSFAAADPYTLSVFVKPNGRTFFRLASYYATGGAGGKNTWFDLTAKAAVSTNALASGVVQLAGGWLRCWMTVAVDTPAETRLLMRMHLATSSSVSSYLGDGVSGVLLFGAQAGQSAALDSYIPTAAANVTRAADLLLTNMPVGSSGMGGYSLAGAYGSVVHPYQAFVTVFRPSGQGLPFVSGYGIPAGAYSTPSRSAYGQFSSGDVTDADIYAAIDATKPVATTVWTRISS